MILIIDSSFELGHLFSLLHLTLAIVNGTDLIPSTTAKLLSRSGDDWISELRFEIEQLSPVQKIRSARGHGSMIVWRAMHELAYEQEIEQLGPGTKMYLSTTRRGSGFAGQ